MDINGDSYVDIVSLQDGDGGGGEGFRNRVLINNQSGGFEDQSSTYWKPLENAPSYDYMLAFLDANSDRKPDMVVGAFANWKDRLLTFTNGTYVGDKGPFGNVITDGTYALAVGDLNNDTKIDLVLGEGENAFRNRVFLAADIGIDTGNPVIQNHVFEGEWTIGATMSVHARAHDNKSPNKDHDWNEVVVEYVVDEEDITNVAELEWYGEYLWRTEFVVPIAKKLRYRICAEDRAGNRECTPVTEVEIFDPEPDDGHGHRHRLEHGHRRNGDDDGERLEHGDRFGLEQRDRVGLELELELEQRLSDGLRLEQRHGDGDRVGVGVGVGDGLGLGLGLGDDLQRLAR